MQNGVTWIIVLALVGLAGCNTDPQLKYAKDDTLVDTSARGPGDAHRPPIPVADARDGVHSNPVFPMDGMVGQINGRPIYADSIFHGDDPIADSLSAIGRRESRPVFRIESAKIVDARLRAMVLDALLLAEAERDLSEAEQMGLRYAMQKQREHLIRQYGRGSIAVAEETIREQTGRTFSQSMDDFRKTLVVRRYINGIIEPKVNVSRRDIERYYREHIKDFRPPATRTIRLIRVANEEAASGVTQRLTAGESFEAVASDTVNMYSFTSGGIMSGIEGDRPLAPVLDPVNDVLASLGAGEYQGPIPVEGRYVGQWFVFLESIDMPPQLSLMDVQLRIEQTLQIQQRQRLTNMLYEGLREQINEQSIRNMTFALVEIAVSRYAVIDDAGALAPDR